MDFKQIEQKQQKKWQENKLFEVKEDKKKPKYYCLEMFPYPSGEGLHNGHALNFTIGDIRARLKTMQGFNVIHPMGFDALGLPAENAAIKAGTHPEDYTNNSIQNFTKQQIALGLSYDWSRMINTASPDFYKWDQWIFLKMLEKGIAYKRKAPVNWCSKCETVLANEQVVNGKCWRHEDTEVEIKHLSQWFFKITDYADELLDKLDELDWPQRTKTMQKNWIGKSYGTEIDFKISSENFKDEISNVVIVHGVNPKDEHRVGTKDYTPQNVKNWLPWIKEELEKKEFNVFTPLMPESWAPNYKKWKNEFEKISVDENSVLIGYSAGGAFLVRWLSETKTKIKKIILVAPAKIPNNDTRGIK
ncbi:MAG: class I tRNA ligase family protein, partial [Candidatus Pacearchaeota archaeon]|nr:class I tRNA ligase family protein [Candidatus Pacearchaeota archaeon]